MRAEGDTSWRFGWHASIRSHPTTTEIFGNDLIFFGSDVEWFDALYVMDSATHELDCMF